MIKLELDFDLSDNEISDAIKPHLEAVTAATASSTAERAKQLAASKLKRGLDHWNKGFSIDKAADGFWIITLSGKMANMMEEGFASGEIKDLILKGNRFKHNQTQGKNYVDVPLALNADALVTSRGIKLEVSSFRNVAELTKAVQVSDWQKGGVRAEQKVIKRIDDIIKSRNANDSSGSSQFLTIRRLTPDSEGWPSSAFPGAKVLESKELDDHIEKAFEDSLRSLI